MEPAVYPLREEFNWLTSRNLKLTLTVLFGAVSGVMLIACVNVANPLLGRSLVRQRELAIRAVLGSGQFHLLRQLLTESLLLSSAGATLGASRRRRSSLVLPSRPYRDAAGKSGGGESAGPGFHLRPVHRYHGALRLSSCLARGTDRSQ
jgi:hypothetical protein